MRPTRLATGFVLLAGLLLGTSAYWPSAAATEAANAAHAADSGNALSLERLMGLLARRPAAQARYQETQHLAILTRPLLSEGILIYRAPDYLEERVRHPRPQDMILDHGELTLQVGRHHRSVPLSDYPQLAPLLDSLRALLAGDQAALKRDFMPQLQGTLEGWRLELTPRSATLTTTLHAIVVEGTDVQIHALQIREVNGDEADLRLEPLSDITAPSAP